MKRILLIDDNVFDYSLLVKRFEDKGVEVHWVTNVFHGKKHLESLQKFDLVVCDVMGTAYNGHEDLSFIKAKVLLTSGSVLMQDQASGYDFVIKDELVKKITELLEK